MAVSYTDADATPGRVVLIGEGFFGDLRRDVALLLGVDALMDMGRTMTNVIGNCLASVVEAKWEGEFREPTAGAAAS